MESNNTVTLTTFEKMVEDTTTIINVCLDELNSFLANIVKGGKLTANITDAKEKKEKMPYSSILKNIDELLSQTNGEEPPKK